MKTYQNYEAERKESFGQLYRDAAQKYGDAPLFLQMNGETCETVSYREFAGRVDALGTALCARGLRGRRVLITGENNVTWITAHLAVSSGVGTAVTADRELPGTELEKIARDADVSAVICPESMMGIFAELPSAVSRIRFEEIPGLIGSGRDRILDGEKYFTEAKLDPNDPTLIFYTSGTTGSAKGVMLSPANVCFSLYEMQQMVSIGPRDRFLSLLPLHLAYEFTCGILFPLSRGASVAFGGGLNRITKDLAAFRPTVLNSFPLITDAMYRKLWSNIRKNRMERRVNTAIRTTNLLTPVSVRLAAKRKMFADLLRSFGGSLRLIICGGAAADPATLKGFRDIGVLCLQSYGLTECGPLAAINRDTAFRDDAAGMNMPDVLLDIYDMREDGIGEVRVKGNNLMHGYFGMPELTAEVLRGGWFYTGDLGYLDKDGFLRIIGRKKNVIVRAGGAQVFPEELESALCRLPLIREAVVTGVLNQEKQDYDLVAVLYPDPAAVRSLIGDADSPAQRAGQIAIAVRNFNVGLPAEKRIKAFVLRDAPFPKNSSNRIVRAGVSDAVNAASRFDL